MSDFLVRMGHDYSAEQMLDLLKQPYGRSAPKGRGFHWPWGTVAVLEDHLGANQNIVVSGQTVLAWVGDLIGGMSDTFRIALAHRLAQLLHSECECDVDLQNDSVFAQLNGAFAILFADEVGFSVVTDPYSTTQVFVGKGSDGEVTAVGTHVDAVAISSGFADALDLPSIAQFLHRGHCAFPHTMYKTVLECQPGAVHVVGARKDHTIQCRQRSYWSPPSEIRTGYNEADLADRLREALLSSVADRRGRKKTGIALSGGLDSRVLMAAVPESDNCMGFTLCDQLNREARTAQRVATVYRRPWMPLVREKEYLGDHLVDVVKFVGCEGEFVHAHLFGFAETICREVDVLLVGDLFGALLRGCLASDYTFRHRLGGLFPRRYEKVPYDYLHCPRSLWEEHLTPEVLDGMGQRLKEYYDRNIGSDRASVAETLLTYPYGQLWVTPVWAAQRRRLPIRFVGTDRRILDFAFSCPIELKLGDKIFLKMAKEILGPGLRIPSANNGVRPCSGHVWRLIQRAIRKSQDRFGGILERCGWKRPIQHSWHNYPAYWRESEHLDVLRKKYGAHLNRLDGTLFKNSGQALLEDKDLFWEYGFRLLQLAIWLGTKKEYRVARQA